MSRSPKAVSEVLNVLAGAFKLRLEPQRHGNRRYNDRLMYLSDDGVVDHLGDAEIVELHLVCALDQST